MPVTATVSQSVSMQGAPFSSVSTAITGQTAAIIEATVPYQATTVNNVEALPVVDSSGVGTFTLTIEGITTAAITYSATIGTVSTPGTLLYNLQAALNAAFGTGNIVPTGANLAGLIFTFSGGNYAGRTLATNITVTPTWSSGSATFGTANTSTTTTPGSAQTISGSNFATADLQMLYLLSDTANCVVTFQAATPAHNTQLTIEAGTPYLWFEGSGTNPIPYDYQRITVLNNDSSAASSSNVHGRTILSA